MTGPNALLTPERRGDDIDTALRPQSLVSHHTRYAKPAKRELFRNSWM